MIAAKHTYGTLASTLSVESGASVRVFKISFYNGTGAPVKFQIQKATDSSVIADVGVSAGETKVYDIEFLADFGVQIASVGSAAASATVFHSSAGS